LTKNKWMKVISFSEIITAQMNKARMMISILMISEYTFNQGDK
jgi:hypothetical protein